MAALVQPLPAIVSIISDPSMQAADDDEEAKLARFKVCP